MWHYRQKNKRAIAIRLDDYVKEILDIPKIKGEIDWEIPESIDYKLAISSIDYYASKFEVVIIEGHLIYANEELVSKIQFPILLQTTISTYQRRKISDTRWGDIPQWYINYIWDAFLKYGNQYCKKPLPIAEDYPTINNVNQYLP